PRFRASFSFSAATNLAREIADAIPTRSRQRHGRPAAARSRPAVRGCGPPRPRAGNCCDEREETFARISLEAVGATTVGSCHNVPKSDAAPGPGAARNAVGDVHADRGR